MTGWNATLLTRDGEEIEPSNKFKGGCDTDTDTDTTRPSVASDVHATKLERTLHETESVHETFQCPECGNKFVNREGEANCLRSHARDRADRLQQRADDGHDILPGVGA